MAVETPAAEKEKRFPSLHTHTHPLLLHTHRLIRSDASGCVTPGNDDNKHQRPLRLCAGGKAEVENIAEVSQCQPRCEVGPETLHCTV